MEKMQKLLKGHEPHEFRQRFKILFVIVTVALSILIFRIWYLQIIGGDDLRQRSENNSIRLHKIEPLRGLIMDNNGQVLVDSRPSFDILFVPNRTTDIHDVIRKLNYLYAEKATMFSTELLPAGKVKPFVPIKLEKNINREKLAIVETHAMDLPGVVVEVDPIRQYLPGEMMTHVLGYTGETCQEELEKDTSGEYSIGDTVGKYGIERYFDRYLRGKMGAKQVEVNVFGQEVKVLGKVEPVSGYSIVLTIDSFLQKIAWDAMKDRAGSVVVMDPRDGSVLAMVSAPSFDPNLFSGGISFADWEELSSDLRHPMENRAISGQYPPGSTYKLIVAAAALEEGLITPETKFFCPGSFDLGNRTYRCWQKKGHGWVDLHRAIVESCDVYFYNLGKLIGVDKLARYARGFGFGAVTGIDLSREKSGLIPTKEWKLAKFGEPWQMGETISLSIGQGFNSVTTIQLLNAYCAVANGGTLWRPRIIKRIETGDGRPFKTFNPEKKSSLPISRKNIDLLNYALWGVVNERGGTGYAARRTEADVCGKTGTAQVIGMPEDRKARREKIIPLRFRDHALFVCFAPYKNSEIAVAVIVEHAGHGGTVAAPIARKIIDAYFKRKYPVTTVVSPKS
ncbi:MAG: penicillin-binding protein 2 [Syntrophales bacterium]|nr:penicillin-binding protein 2 [Syntrophales bacterium]